MFEIPTNARQTEAICIAHAERARVFAKVFGTIFNMQSWVKVLPNRHSPKRLVFLMPSQFAWASSQPPDTAEIKEVTTKGKGRWIERPFFCSVRSS